VAAAVTIAKSYTSHCIVPDFSKPTMRRTAAALSLVDRGHDVVEEIAVVADHSTMPETRTAASA